LQTAGRAKAQKNEQGGLSERAQRWERLRQSFFLRLEFV